MALGRPIPLLQLRREERETLERWRRHIEYFWVPNDEQLLVLVDGYNNDPRFKVNFDKIHPNLARFMREAVRVYVKSRKK